MTEPLPKVWLQSQFVVRSVDGLHARPAINLSQLARQFFSAIQVRSTGDQQWVDAKSVAKLMGLRIQGGKIIEVRACGDDAGTVIASISGFFENDLAGENEGA
jgi:phosphocarrier protein